VEPGADVIAIAASAGGLHALRGLVASLPASLSVPVLVVQHLDPRRPSHIADILGRATTLRVKEAQAGERALAGTIYIAPPDLHLLVAADHTLSLSHTPRVRFVRPSADCLFESVAAAYGARAIAVVLTGTGSDGVKGAQAIKHAGGAVVAQDEATAEFFGMPGAVIASGCVDVTLPLSQIAPALVALAGNKAAVA
jgi:two-component system chemotaxis response regulator CheB